MVFRQLIRTDFYRRIFIVLAVAGMFSVPMAVQAAELEPSPAAIETTFAIDNFGRVAPNVWRGASPTDQALDQLAGNGVKTVIDLRYSGSGCKHEEKVAAKLGLKYIHMPIGFGKVTSKEIMSFLKIVRNPANLPVYIHCRQGSDRTGSLVGAYRILVQNWTFEKTYSEMRAYHFKPWLFSMKKSVARVADDKSVRQAVQVAFNDK